MAGCINSVQGENVPMTKVHMTDCKHSKNGMITITQLFFKGEIKTDFVNSQKSVHKSVWGIYEL